MARKEQTITIQAEGRDKGKRFHIRELPASQAEKWAIRALLAVGNAGIEVPSGIESQGMAGLVAVGIQSLSKLPFSAAEPLLDEMFTCVQANPSEGVLRPLMEQDIEEVVTRLTLRKAILGLHTDFFSPAAPLTSESAPQAKPEPSLIIKRRPKQ